MAEETLESLKAETAVLKDHLEFLSKERYPLKLFRKPRGLWAPQNYETATAKSVEEEMKLRQEGFEVE